MILSNQEIHQALDDGKLVIKPEPQPRELCPGRECPYQTSSVDLTLGDEVSRFDLEHKPPVVIDLREGKFKDLFTPHSRDFTITEEQPYVLMPGTLVLAKTYEMVSLPLGVSPCLAARVEGKSSYARCGLMVHFTAPTIHAGFAGTITLELINFGPFKIALYPRMPICQLIIEQVSGTPFRNDSQFQGQHRPSGT